MVTISSIILLISMILTLSGYLHAMQVIYTEADFILDDDGNLTIEYKSDSIEILVLNVDSEEIIDFILVVYDSSGDEVFNITDETLSMNNIPFLENGDFEIVIDVIDESDDPLDLTIEIMKTGSIFMVICMSVMCLGVIFLPLLVVGGVATIAGAMEMRRSDRGYRR